MSAPQRDRHTHCPWPWAGRRGCLLQLMDSSWGPQVPQACRCSLGEQSSWCVQAPFCSPGHLGPWVGSSCQQLRHQLPVLLPRQVSHKSACAFDSVSFGSPHATLVLFPPGLGSPPQLVLHRLQPGDGTIRTPWPSPSPAANSLRQRRGALSGLRGRGQQEGAGKAPSACFQGSY